MKEPIKRLLYEAYIDSGKRKLNALKLTTGLNYRTTRELVSMYNSESIPEEIMDELLNPEYYTIENCISLYNNDLESLIPHTMYENKEFVEAAKVTKLPDNFLSGDDNITSFNILPEIEYVGDNAFKFCTHLKEIRGDKVLQVGSSAFENCSALETAFFPVTQKFGTKVFKNCKELTVVTTAPLTTFSESMFESCRNLISVNYDSITLAFAKVEARAFYNCLNLRELKALCIYVGEDAFYNCKRLVNVYLHKPDVVRQGALENCRSLENVFFLNASEDVNLNLFNGCTKIKYITLSDYAYKLQYCNNMNTILYQLREKNSGFKVKYTKDLNTNLRRQFNMA